MNRRHRNLLHGLPLTVTAEIDGPGRDQAVEWFVREGLAILDEDFRWEDGWGYRHFLLRGNP